MTQVGSPLELPLWLVRPPYEEAIRLADVPTQAPRGSIAIIDARARTNPEDLTDLVWHLRLECGITPVVRLPSHLLLRRPQTAVRYQSVGVCAVIGDAELIRDALWRALSAPVSLEGYWFEWVCAKRPAMPPGLSPILEIVVRDSDGRVRISDLLRRHDVSARSVRSQIKRANLPSLSRWGMGARLVKAQLRLQRAPDLSVGEVAREYGYQESASLSDAIRRYFDCSAVVSRQLLGLDWRLHAWWDGSFR